MREVRPTIVAPIVLFTYVNPVMRMGADRFMARAAESGVDGVLLLDLPIEESAGMQADLDAARPGSDLSREPDDHDGTAARMPGAWGAGFCTRFRGWASRARAKPSPAARRRWWHGCAR